LNSEVVRLICGEKRKKVPGLVVFLILEKINSKILVRRSIDEAFDKES
jgi:hypothetical protein